MSALLYVLIAIAVVNMLAVVALTRLGRHSRSGTAHRPALIVRRLTHPRAGRRSSQQSPRAPTRR
jgi:hypothetical protein